MHTYLTHPDWPPLLAAIRATPDDDLPRMVAADWLDEQPADSPCVCSPDHPDWVMRTSPCRVCKTTGRVSSGCGERAELIRVGCEIARMIRHQRNLTLRFDDLRQRVSVLSAKLFPALDNRPTTPHPFRIFFDRGFVAEVDIPFDWWASRADVIVPEGVNLTVRINTTAEWEDHPEGTPAYRLVGRKETFGELAVLTACERHPSTAAALCALTWPTVSKWSVILSGRRARHLVRPQDLVAPGT